MQVIRILALVLVASCAEPATPARRPSPDAGCTLTPGSCQPPRGELPPAQREARLAIDAYRERKARCGAGAGGLECIDVFPPLHPCAPPRYDQAPASLMAGVNYTKFYFDGTRCYQPTAEQPGPCAAPRQCTAWSSVAACEAAQQICREEGL